jgi:hypothetical protein
MKKTFVVGINLHGEITLDKDSNPETRHIDSRFIVKMDAVSPGVPNISTFENYNNLSEITGELVRSRSNNWLNHPMQSKRKYESYKEKMVDFVTTLKRRFMDENKKNVKGIEQVYAEKMRCNEPCEHEQNFIHNKDTLYTISSFDTGDAITNKLFLKFTPEELDHLHVDEDDLVDKGFNKIIIYNLDNIDVFDLLGPEYTQITLFNLIDLFTGMGAENIIFIDMSCSVFPFDSQISKRTIRNLRKRIRKLHGPGKGGGNKYRTKKIKNIRVKNTRKSKR